MLISAVILTEVDGQIANIKPFIGLDHAREFFNDLEKQQECYVKSRTQNTFVVEAPVTGRSTAFILATHPDHLIGRNYTESTLNIYNFLLEAR